MKPKMVKNLYRCEKCSAQMIAQNPQGYTTPMLIKCRAPKCNELARSTFYSLAQDVLADAHLEFVYEGGTSGDNIKELKQLRPVPAYKMEF